MSECFIIPVWLVGIICGVWSIISWYLVLNCNEFINPKLHYFINKSTFGICCLLCGIIPATMCAGLCVFFYSVPLFEMILNSLPCIQFVM